MLAEVEAETLSNNLVKVMAELLVDTLTDSVTTDRRQFILCYLFYFSPFLSFLFAYLRFGSHFRSHDSHGTGEHMVELGAIFCCCFFCKSKQFFNVQVQGHVHCIFKVTFLVQVQEAVFRE